MRRRTAPRSARFVPVLFAVLAPALIPPARAQAPLALRMASPFPDGSSWHLVLKETAEKWKALSSGRVTVRLFPGGVAGDDLDVVRKMRQGTLDAAVVGPVGLGEIDRAVHALAVPLLYDSQEEALFVLERMRPRLEASFEAKGFVVLGWTDAGWVRFFTRKPVAAPEDLRALKLLSWAGDAELLAVWRAAGFDPVPVPPTELASALQSGLVGAVGVPPQVALLSQVATHAPNMTDLRWHLVLQATLVARASWEKVPAELRTALRDEARAAGGRLRQAGREREDRDVEAMRKRGLKVVAVSPAQRAAWRKLTEGLHSRIRGGLVPADAFDEALRLRDEHRRGSARPGK
jgi:TRAP-type transport system periplasmic protein